MSNGLRFLILFLASVAAIGLLLLWEQANASDTIPRVGSCPVGYRTSGAYCIRLDDQDDELIIKRESCPVGYRTSGNYCIKLEDDR